MGPLLISIGGQITHQRKRATPPRLRSPVVRKPFAVSQTGFADLFSWGRVLTKRKSRFIKPPPKRFSPGSPWDRGSLVVRSLLSHMFMGRLGPEQLAKPSEQRARVGSPLFSNGINVAGFWTVSCMFDLRFGFLLIGRTIGISIYRNLNLGTKSAKSQLPEAKN